MAPSDERMAPGGQEGGGAPDQHPVDEASRRLGYEVSDASGRALAWVMAVSVTIIAVSIAGLFVLIAHYRREDARHPPLTIQQRAAIAPPGPNLQDEPLRDIASERRREADLLAGFAYLDPDHRRARIPIERAEALVVGRSLDAAP